MSCLSFQPPRGKLKPAGPLEQVESQTLADVAERSDSDHSQVIAKSCGKHRRDRCDHLYLTGRELADRLQVQDSQRRVDHRLGGHEGRPRMIAVPGTRFRPPTRLPGKMKPTVASRPSGTVQNILTRPFSRTNERPAPPA